MKLIPIFYSEELLTKRSELSPESWGQFLCNMLELKCANCLKEITHKDEIRTERDFKQLKIGDLVELISIHSIILNKRSQLKLDNETSCNRGGR